MGIERLQHPTGFGFSHRKMENDFRRKGFGGAVLMDLSKAFDTLNHELLIAKLHAYGFNRDSLKLINDYLSNRWQRTRINKSLSS